MPHRMVPGWRQLLLALLVPVLACQREGPKAAETVEVSKELGPGTFDLADTRAGLAQLSSYEAILTVSFDGTRSGQPVWWSSLHKLQVAKSPPARRLVIKELSTDTQSKEAFMAESSGAAYRWSAGNDCAATILDTASSRFRVMEPAASLPGVLGAEEAGTGMLNGVKANHYTFDERALAEMGLNASKGELWIAAEGGYVLRYRLATVGDTAYFGDRTQGTMTWNYELTRINQPVTIELPAGCSPGLVEAPMLPNASSIERHPGVLRYQTATPVPAAASFYEKELGSSGWKTPEQSNPMAQALADPEVRAALADPEVRQIMKGMGLNLPGQPSRAERRTDEAYLVFQKGGQGEEILRVRITRGDGADTTTQILVLSSARN